MTKKTAKTGGGGTARRRGLAVPADATAAMDILLRMLRDLPGSLEYLRRRAA